MTMVGTDSWEKGGQLLDQSYWNDYTAQLNGSAGGSANDLLGRWQASYTSINAANCLASASRMADSAGSRG